MTQQKISPVLIVHGGAWAIPDDMVEAHLRGVRAAMAAGWKLLADGENALAAVEAAVVAMETTKPSMPAVAAFSPRTDASSLMVLRRMAKPSAPVAPASLKSCATP